MEVGIWPIPNLNAKNIADFLPDNSFQTTGSSSHYEVTTKSGSHYEVTGSHYEVIPAMKKFGVVESDTSGNAATTSDEEE